MEKYDGADFYEWYGDYAEWKEKVGHAEDDEIVEFIGEEVKE
jgi:hypothetical protein